MCLFPKLISNPKYKATKKNGGNIPPVSDERVKLVPIGCNKCLECRKQKGREWRTRLAEQLKETPEAKFVTFTFSTDSLEDLSQIIFENQPTIEGYDIDNEIATLAVRRFLERWRWKHKKSVKHWLITEVGGGRYEHMHIHGILFTNATKDTITDTWGYGFTFIGDYVNQTTINYITKYLTKTDEKHPNFIPRILTSKGIGSRYTKIRQGDWLKNKFKAEETNEAYRLPDGTKTNLPIYYRNKIYTEEEREKLWLIKLDKQKRYILGQEVDISENEDEYWAGLKEAQKKNKRMGYGGNEQTWEEQEYEKQRRKLKLKERMNKKNNKKNKKEREGGG